MTALSPYEYKRLPEIYQVELTNACNLNCPRCIRKEAVNARGGVANLDVRHLRHWVERGDFAGSWYVELQMSGEPLLHKRVGEVVDVLHHEAGVWVGMATSGLLLERKAAEAAKLDAITVSIDTQNPAEYERVRPGAQLEQIERGIDALLSQPTRPRFLNICTVAGIEEPRSEVGERVAALSLRFPEFTVTSVVDCRAAYQDSERYACASGQELCINPWTSVSVQSDGGVVSCCYAWDRRAPNYLGSLREATLREIWVGERAEHLRELMRAGKYQGYCAVCYARSPFLLHMDGLARFTKEELRGR